MVKNGANKVSFSMCEGVANKMGGNEMKVNPRVVKIQDGLGLLSDRAQEIVGKGKEVDMTTIKAYFIDCIEGPRMGEEGTKTDEGESQINELIEGPKLYENQVMNQSSDPSLIKTKTMKWKKITRSLSQRAIFGPSSPIQEMLSNKCRTRSGSKSLVIKVSPRKVNDVSTIDLELGDDGTRQGLDSPELDRGGK
ncbi:hypothetical protein ACOSQ4_018723 [Xanthoceras sorbifolium]